MSDSNWIKSSLSFVHGNCVEVRALPGGQFEVRNSRFPDQASLTFTSGEWEAFLGGIRAGEFDPGTLPAG
jgi:hypothetical protein